MMAWQDLNAGDHRTEFHGEAGVIEAIVHIPENINDAQIKAVAVCCHPHPLFEGAMTNKVVHTLAKVMTKLGMIAVRFNFRGVGKSEGEHDHTRGETRDLVAICEVIKQQFPAAQIWLSGFSFGSYVSAKAAAEVGAAQLISVSPPVGHYDFNDITDPGCPWLVLMGEVDEVVSPEAVFNWLAESPERYTVIRFPETGHFYHGKLVKMMDLLKSHFEPVVDAL
ncbi:MAG: alpha/beta fold hydrolase [Gammaproteobacteria bacterium]